MDMLESARKGKRRVGQKDLINHLQGKRLTQRQAIRAKCYDCNGMGECFGCDNSECSLFPYSPYKIPTGPTFIEASAIEKASKKVVAE